MSTARNARPIISHDLRMAAIKTVMWELRGSGPASIDRLKSVVIFQTPGATRDNIDEIFSFIWPMMTRRRVEMVQEYEMISPEPGDVKVYEVADRMYDANGHYKGGE